MAHINITVLVDECSNVQKFVLSFYEFLLRLFKSVWNIYGTYTDWVLHLRYLPAAFFLDMLEQWLNAMPKK